MVGFLQLKELFKFVIDVARCEVFFDDLNEKIFIVDHKPNAEMKLSVTIVGSDGRLDYWLPYREDPITAIKLSPAETFLAIQRGRSHVEFVTYRKSSKNSLSKQFSQKPKTKNCQVMGMEWASDSEILITTDRGLELFQVQSEKGLVKALKSHNIYHNWFLYSARHQLMVLSSGTIGNVLNPFLIRSNAITRLPKFEVELCANPQPPRLMLLDRDVTLVDIYGEICALILRHNPRPGSAGAEILVYKLSKDPSVVAQKTWVLHLGVTDRFAVHVIDSLVVVHHQGSKASCVFDVAVGGVGDNSCAVFEPFISGESVVLAAPLGLASVVPDADSDGAGPVDCALEMYSPDWVTFQPDLVVDAHAGFVGRMTIKLEAVLSLIPDRLSLFEFLLHRLDAKPLVLRALRDHILSQNMSLLDASKIFDRFNGIYQSYLLSQEGPDGQKQPQTAGTVSQSNRIHANCLVIEQSDVYTLAFFPLFDMETMNKERLANLIVEYLLSVQTREIIPHLFLHEMLVKCLVEDGKFQRLLQLLQYHILPDSKPLAFLLLSLEAQFPSSLQLAVDMLLRMHTTNEEIIEILIEKEKVLQALKFLQSTGCPDVRDPLKFLEAARKTQNGLIYFATFNFFETRSQRLHGSQHFGQGEQYNKFLRIYNDLKRCGSFASSTSVGSSGSVESLRRLSIGTLTDCD